MKFTSLLLLFTTLLYSCEPTATTTPKTDSPPEINSEIQQVMDKVAEEFLGNDGIYSVSIGVLKDGKSQTAHYGEMDPGKGNPPTDDTRYEIASVTKTFTGTLVAQAVLDGKMDLDADIRDYLDGDYPNLEYQGNPIQLRHLLSHTSRLPGNNKGVDALMENRDDSTAFRFLELEKQTTRESYFAFLHEIELDTLPGTTRRYSNFGANLTAHLLENVYDKSYPDLLEEYILSKAGMYQTALNLSDKELPYLINGYNHLGWSMPHLPMPVHLWGAAGGLKSTIPDLIRYMEFQIAEENPAVVESHKKILEEDEDVWMGYFWNIEKNADGVILYDHHGGAFGMQNWFWVSPKYKLGLSIATNSSSPNTGGVLRTALGALIDDLKPFGKRSIRRKIAETCKSDVDAGIAMYKQLQKDSPEGYNFSNQNELNVLGYELMRVEKFEEALKIFILNTEQFPEASNPWDSLAEVYMNMEKYEEALKYYQKSIDLNPENQNAVNMMEQIKELQNG